MRTSAAPSAPLRASNTRASYNASTAGSNDWEKESAYAKTIEDMTQQTMELKVTVEGLEKERDFYFGKLREIELIVQRELEHGKHEAIMKEIQQIMYKTEDGFEIPDPNAEAAAEATEVF
jgi:microtubule-associated protein, RP/EB family